MTCFRTDGQDFDSYYAYQYILADDDNVELAEITYHQIQSDGANYKRTDRATSASHSKLLALAEKARVPMQVDLMETAKMYLTSQTPSGDPLTAEAIAMWPLVAAT